MKNNKMIENINTLKQIRGILSVAILVMMTLCSCNGGGGGSASEPVSKEEFCLDTICTISIYAMETANGDLKPAADLSDEAEIVIGDAFKRCKELEDLLSKTRKDSDISKINEANGAWIKVEDETLELLQKGMYYSELSGGDFDITVGRITDLWDFHAAEGKEKIPSDEALKEAAEHVYYKNVEIKGSSVRLKDKQSRIDLGGIAKGFIGDKIAELIEERGVRSAIINLGGNVICIGGKSEADDFVIGVEAPFSDRSEIVGKLKVRDATVVTSGVYERIIEVEGKMYHHILDTKTGWPVQTDLDAVSLIADKGHSADIDALSTICLIKGRDKAMELIEGLDGIEAVFVKSNGEIDCSSAANFEKEQ